MRQAAVSPAPPAAPSPKPVQEARPAAKQTPVIRKSAEPKPPAPVAVRAPAPPAPEQKLSLNAPKNDRVVRNTEAAPPGKPTAKMEQAAVTYQVVNVPFDDVLNVRNGPSPLNEIVSTIRPRTKGVEMAGNCEGEWCPIRHGNKQGWVNRYFLAAETSNRMAALAGRSGRNPLTYRVVRVPAGDVLNLRRRPDSEAAVVATIPPTGNHIRLTGYCVEEWCPVAYGQSTGWAHRNFLALEY